MPLGASCAIHSFRVGAVPTRRFAGPGRRGIWNPHPGVRWRHAFRGVMCYTGDCHAKRNADNAHYDIATTDNNLAIVDFSAISHTSRPPFPPPSSTALRPPFDLSPILFDSPSTHSESPSSLLHLPVIPIDFLRSKRCV